MNSQFISILVILVPILGVIMFAKSKKKKNKTDTNSSRDQSELWTVLKKFLKDEGSIGKEIIDCYFQKRQNKEYKKRSIFVVIFKTRDSKTLLEDESRAIELEIITKSLDNKQKREIIVNSEKDYESEIGWITEARKKEIEREKKLEQKNKIAKEKKEIKLNKKKQVSSAKKNMREEKKKLKGDS